MNTTRRFPRSLSEAFPQDYANAVEVYRPVRFSQLAALVLCVVVSVLALAIKFGVGE